MVKFLWKFCDLILIILGLTAITVGLFLWNKIIGFIGGGVALIALAVLIDTIPPQQGKGGGDN